MKNREGAKQIAEFISGLLSLKAKPGAKFTFTENLSFENRLDGEKVLVVKNSEGKETEWDISQSLDKHSDKELILKTLKRDILNENPHLISALKESNGDVVSFMVRANVGKEGYQLGYEVNDGRTIEEKKEYLSALKLYGEMLSTIDEVRRENSGLTEDEVNKLVNDRLQGLLGNLERSQLDMVAKIIEERGDRLMSYDRPEHDFTTRGPSM